MTSEHGEAAAGDGQLFDFFTSLFMNSLVCVVAVLSISHAFHAFIPPPRPRPRAALSSWATAGADGDANARAGVIRGVAATAHEPTLRTPDRPRERAPIPRNASGDNRRSARLARLRKARRQPDVARLLEQLLPLRDAREFTLAIGAWGRAGEWKRALALLREMRYCGVEPNVISYSAAMSACEKSAQWERAIALLREMRYDGIEPNVISYSAAISACAKGSQWQRALELLKEMQDRGLEPDVISYSSAMSACEKGAQCEPALALFDEMVACGLEPNASSFSAVIGACHAAGARAAARRMYRASDARGLRAHWRTRGAMVPRLDLHELSAAEATAAVGVVLEAHLLGMTWHTHNDLASAPLEKSRSTSRSRTRARAPARGCRAGATL